MFISIWTGLIGNLSGLESGGREKRDILGVQVPKVEFSILHYYDGMHLPNLEDKLCFS